MQINVMNKTILEEYAYDDTSGEPLDPKEVKKARMDEVG